VHYRKLLRDQLRKNPGLVVVVRQMQQRALGITTTTLTNTTAAAVNGQMSTRGATRSSTTTAAAAAAAASAAAVAKPVLTPEATRQAVIQWETHVQGLPIDPNTTVSALSAVKINTSCSVMSMFVSVTAIKPCTVLQK
jgi:hypothetical protein